MKLARSARIAKPVSLVVAVAAILWLSDYLYGRKQIETTRVGGTMNQCTCSQRLER